MAGHGGLQDAVADGGDQHRAHFVGAGLFLDDDFEEGQGAVSATIDAGAEAAEVGLVAFGEMIDGDAVRSGAAVVFLDAEPGVFEIGLRNVEQW